MFTPFILHFNDINSTKYYILLSSDDLKYLRKSIRKNALITKPIPNKGQLLAESSQMLGAQRTYTSNEFLMHSRLALSIAAHCVCLVVAFD